MRNTLVTIAIACTLLVGPLTASEPVAAEPAEIQPAGAGPAPAATLAEMVAPGASLCGAVALGPFSPAAHHLGDKGGRDDGSLPPPEELCLTGWCSNHSQCVEWFEDPYCRCIKESGATCGQCECP